MTGFPLRPRGNTTCALRAFGVVEATPETLTALRKKPGPDGSLPMPAHLLNHADDQTVVALAAVLHAIHDARLSTELFSDWAVLGAPRFPGRVSFSSSLDKFRRSGSLSVSPLIIPFQSLHVVSSMISLALQIHGPSMGVGGGSDGFVQALLAGLALQQEQNVSGVWVVATGWDPEIVPETESHTHQPVCRAAALALLPATAGARGSHLRLVPRTDFGAQASAAPSLRELVRFLTAQATINPLRRWSCPVNRDFNLEMSVENTAAEVSRHARSA